MKVTRQPQVDFRKLQVLSTSISIYYLSTYCEAHGATPPTSLTDDTLGELLLDGYTLINIPPHLKELEEFTRNRNGSYYYKGFSWESFGGRFFWACPKQFKFRLALAQAEDIPPNEAEAIEAITKTKQATKAQRKLCKDIEDMKQIRNAYRIARMVSMRSLTSTAVNQPNIL